MSSSQPSPAIFFDTKTIFSSFLDREVTLSIVLPSGYHSSENYPLILFNDGQDFPALDILNTLTLLESEQAIVPHIIVGIHANFDRIYEYGTAARPDYAGRGNKAAMTTHFVLHELLAHLKEHYHTQTDHVTYAGFSLGGLMALDMAWHHPGIFSKVGVFSGSLWWRQKALDAGYDDSDRIMHALIRESAHKPELRFWFQCGGLDEYDDRDGDGIIDSIQDTLECIAELEKKGYAWNKDIFYTEISEGRHNTETWAQVLPAFLRWVSGE